MSGAGGGGSFPFGQRPRGILGAQLDAVAGSDLGLEACDDALDLGVVDVLLARPEEAAQAVLASTRHDVRVQMTDASYMMIHDPAVVVLMAALDIETLPITPPVYGLTSSRT